MSDSNVTPFFAGEMQLAGWSESHTGGCKVTFWLASPDDLAVFRLMTVRKGNQSGQRIMAALVEVGDDEIPIQQKLGDACLLAVQWCKDPQFWNWIGSELIDRTMWFCTSEEQAKTFICNICGVKSRREIDADPAALKLWNQKILIPFRDYLAIKSSA